MFPAEFYVSSILISSRYDLSSWVLHDAKGGAHLRRLQDMSVWNSELQVKYEFHFGIRQNELQHSDICHQLTDHSMFYKF
jgi:hypothetical protein